MPLKILRLMRSDGIQTTCVVQYVEGDYRYQVEDCLILWERDTSPSTASWIKELHLQQAQDELNRIRFESPLRDLTELVTESSKRPNRGRPKGHESPYYQGRRKGKKKDGRYSAK